MIVFWFFISEGKRFWRLNLSVVEIKKCALILRLEREVVVFYLFVYWLHILPSFSPIVVRIRNLRHPTQGEIVQKVDGVSVGVFLKKYVEKVLLT